MITKKYSIHAKAPARIDLAGGTLDIWPIFLFLDCPLTINLAISLFAETHLEITESHQKINAPDIIMSTQDQKIELRLSWEDLDQDKIQIPAHLLLHYKFLQFFYKKKKVSPSNHPAHCALKLSTSAQSPAGAGLGGSSVLSISIAGALNAWVFPNARDQLQKDDLISIVRDIETTVIEVPAGLQDAYAGAFGGIQALRWGIARHTQEHLPNDLLKELEKRILLFYSGTSRNSGINNWALYKSFIDKTLHTRSQFEGINQATQALEKALLQKNWQTVAEAIRSEWLIRRTLAQGITTPAIDQAFEKACEMASKTQSITGKICGAGGGGCFFIYLPNGSGEGNAMKIEVQKIFHDHGMRSIEFQAVANGLEVQRDEAV